jgi:uncharacterized protein (DUF58 family)
MATVRLTTAEEAKAGPRHGEAALDVARRLPRLALEARRVAAAAHHGVHGRRRAGPGETFWQFRAFTPGEPSNRIDWRRSARDDRTYVREREWEAAHTIRLWFDLSPSMGFVSSLAMAPKIDQALVTGLAVSDMLVRAGERVGLLGGPPATAHRSIVDRLCETIVLHARAGDADRPPEDPLPQLAEAVLLTDGLMPPAELVRAIENISARGARGHLMLIADPVEEVFPFSGHTELVEPELAARLRVGSADDFRGTYLARLASHRDQLATVCRRRGWSYFVHRTDSPASQAVLTVMGAIAAGRRVAGTVALGF